MGSVGKSTSSTTTQIDTSNGTYEITPHGNGFTVQLNGDERYFSDYDKAVEAVWANAYWVDAPLIDKQGLYTRDDLQRMIDFIRGNVQAKNAFISQLGNNADGRAIARVINEGSVEEFDRYDSDVAEQFIDYYNNFA